MLFSWQTFIPTPWQTAWSERETERETETETETEGPRKRFSLSKKPSKTITVRPRGRRPPSTRRRGRPKRVTQHAHIILGPHQPRAFSHRFKDAFQVAEKVLPSPSSPVHPWGLLAQVAGWGNGNGNGNGNQRHRFTDNKNTPQAIVEGGREGGTGRNEGER